MMRRTHNKQQLPIPLWVIGLCGIFAGGMLALDQPANAKNTKKEGAVAAKAAIEPAAETATPAASEPAPPVVTTTQSTENTEAAAQPIAAAPAPKQSDNKIVYSDSPRENRSAGLGMKNLLALLLLASVAGGAMYYAKRKQKATGPLKQSRTMSLVDTLRLGGRYSISLVHVPGRLLVIGSTEKGMNLLTEMSEGEALAGQPNQTVQDIPPVQPQPSNDHGLVRDENDEFFNHLMHRISQAGDPPMSQPETIGNPAASSLRSRLQQYQFGPSNA